MPVQIKPSQSLNQQKFRGMWPEISQRDYVIRPGVGRWNLAAPGGKSHIETTLRELNQITAKR
jgi:hypothetical protein